MARKKIPSKLKKIVFSRANGSCEYCWVSSDFSSDFFPIDHIISYSRSGSSKVDNLALTCSLCNGHKYNKITHLDPLTDLESPLFHPRKDFWLDHFEWNEDETLILGITPKGRATVALLKVNRISNINLRSLLLLVGLHPPTSYPEN